jgi:hypothetical protein
MSPEERHNGVTCIVDMDREDFACAKFFAETAYYTVSPPQESDTPQVFVLFCAGHCSNPTGLLGVTCCASTF